MRSKPCKEQIVELENRTGLWRWVAVDVYGGEAGCRREARTLTAVGSVRSCLIARLAAAASAKRIAGSSKIECKYVIFHLSSCHVRTEPKQVGL